MNRPGSMISLSPVSATVGRTSSANRAQVGRLLGVVADAESAADVEILERRDAALR